MKVKRTWRNWLLFAAWSYVIVSVLMGLGLAFSPANAGGRFVAFVYSFVAPLDIIRQVVEQPGNERVWRALGSVCFMFAAVLWVMSSYLMVNPDQEREEARQKKLKELRGETKPDATQDEGR